MEMDYTLLCVIVIVMIGVAISIYSMCKGCSGLQERGMTARTFFTPTSVIVQQLRARQANSSDPYTISGSAVEDKNPPLYEELFAPPPSYEETMQMIKALSEAKAKPSPTPQLHHPHQVTLVIQPELNHSSDFPDLAAATNEKEQQQQQQQLECKNVKEVAAESNKNLPEELNSPEDHLAGPCSLRIEEM